MAKGHEGSHSSTDAALASKEFATYRGEEIGHAVPFQSDGSPHPLPAALSASRFPAEIVVDREVGMEWQRAERREMLDYRIPYVFQRDPQKPPRRGGLA